MPAADPPADPDAAARTALRLIGPDPQDWVPDRPGIDHNVMIVGGGQSGSAFAFALRRAGIGKVAVVDMAVDEHRAGVWRNAARMNVLRTAKTLPGPEYGIAALSFQAWYEARHGEAAYAAIERIPREDLGRLSRLVSPISRHPDPLRHMPDADRAGGWAFPAVSEGDDIAGVETARKVILANGVAGNGGAYIPPRTADGAPRLYAHTADRIDFAGLAGRRVAVVGGAASAFDAAGVALEAGAASVDLFARRSALASLPVARVRGYPGAYDNFPALPDAVRWHQAIRFRRAGSTAPADAIERVLKYPNFRLHLAAQWLAAREETGRILAQAADGEFSFDFAIAGTGYFVDPGARPELADFADRILLWRDRYTPSPEERDDYLGAHPYLGAAHEYLEKTPGEAPYLKDIHVQNPAGFVSFGVPVGDVPSMKRGLPAVTQRISHDLFFADFAAHQQRLTGDIAPEFPESLYAAAVWQPVAG